MNYKDIAKIMRAAADMTVPRSCQPYPGQQQFHQYNLISHFDPVADQAEKIVHQTLCAIARAWENAAETEGE